MGTVRVPATYKAEKVAWSAMLQRVGVRSGGKARDIANYRERGITVCERWLVYTNFLDDMGPRPSPKHSLDRINNDGNYEPGNCRWATSTEQNRNTRANILLTYAGKTQCMADWAEELGISYSAIKQRVRRGWTAEETLTGVRRRSRRQKLKKLNVSHEN